MTALLVQGAAALAVVGALVWAQRRLRRARGAPHGAALEIVERLALGRECGLAVVRWDGREVLVGYGSSGVSAVLGAAAPREEVLP